MSFQQKKKRPDWNSLMAGCAGFTPPATAERETGMEVLRSLFVPLLLFVLSEFLTRRSKVVTCPRSRSRAPAGDDFHTGPLSPSTGHLDPTHQKQDRHASNCSSALWVSLCGALCSLFKGTSERCEMLCCLLTVVWETSTWWQHRHFIHCLTVSDFCQEMSPKFDRSVANMKGFAPPPNGL